ncbi:MAG: nuclear transport factor 2 family protein [Chitinophagaceae bacterium]
MRSFFILLTTVFIGQTVFAQQAEDSVKAVINTMFTAMRNGNAASFKSVFADKVIMQTISRNKEGKTIVRDENINEFAEVVGKMKKDSADERISFETIRIDGPLAIVWTPYNFYLNGAFSHCGVNSFQLVKLDGAWKIQYLIDTRRRTGCQP